MSWIGVDATLLAFVLGYTLSMMYITVFYHRGFTHNAVELNPSVRRFVLLTGPWSPGSMFAGGRACIGCTTRPPTCQAIHTALLKWECSVLSRATQELRSVLFGLVKNKDDYVSVVADIPEPVSWASRHRVWYLPAFPCPLVAVTVAWLLGVVPRSGIRGRAHEPSRSGLAGQFLNATPTDIATSTPRITPTTPCRSIATFGEGLHNNHHYAPASARLRYRWFEPDLSSSFVGVSSPWALDDRRDTLLQLTASSDDSRRRQNKAPSPGPHRRRPKEPQPPSRRLIRGSWLVSSSRCCFDDAVRCGGLHYPGHPKSGLSEQVSNSAASRSRPFASSSISRSTHLPAKSRSCSGSTASTSSTVASAPAATRTFGGSRRPADRASRGRRF